MFKLQVHFYFMIIIFVISALLAIYVSTRDNSHWFFKLISIVLIFMIIFMTSFKETFLPFLGSTVYPLGLIPNEMYPPKSNFTIELDFDYPNGSKVIYWSANAQKEKDGIFENPKDAYGDYSNSGIAIINNKKAVLHIHCPNKYKVPMAGVLDKHIHYRIAVPDSPIISDVRTTYIKC
jgi:hypothetical protein